MAHRLRHVRWLGWIIGLLALTALACNMQPQPTPLPTARPDPQRCVEYSGYRGDYPRPTDPVGYQTTILDFLNRGGSPADLLNLLRGWGAIDDQIGGHVDASHDLNEDYRYDVLVTFHYPLTAAAPQPPGQLLILGCNGPNARYEVLYGFASAPDTAQSMPKISYTMQDAFGVALTTNAIQDITLDGLPEIIFYVEQCTRLACFREPIILTWGRSTSRFLTLSEPFTVMYTYTDDLGRPVRGLPNAGLSVISAGQNQPYNVVIKEGDPFAGIDENLRQREFGPFRPVEHIWTWHGDRYLHTAVNPAPSDYYIHILRDADQYLRVSDLDDAILAYELGLNGENVRTWGGIFYNAQNDEIERDRLDAYANYRLVLAYTALRDGRAAQLVQSMQAARPWQQTDIPSYYTLLATTFYNQFLAVSSRDSYENALRLACEEVKNTIARSPSLAITYTYLADPDYFGPLIGSYTVDDLCPFQ